MKPYSTLLKIFRVFLSISLVLGLIFYYADSFKSIQIPNPYALLGGAIILLMAYASMAKRWDAVLRTHGYQAKFRNLYLCYLGAQFLSNFIPGVSGGDVVRPLMLKRMENAPYDLKNLYSAIAFERIAGMISLSLVAFFAAGFSYLFKPSFETRILLLISTVIIIALWFAIRFKSVLKLMIRESDSKIWSTIEIVINNFLSYTAKKPLVLKALIYSFAFQALVILMYSLFAQALSGKFFLLEISVAVAFGSIISVIPISMNGIGIRESSLVFSFLIFGHDPQLAVNIGLGGLLLLISIPLAGGIMLIMKGAGIGLRRSLEDGDIPKND